jgi:outer membrane immunogenic protein
MKKILLGAIATVALFSTAFAADLPARTYTKAPAAVASPIYNWGGFYIGLNGGGGSARDCWTISAAPTPVPVANEGCHNATGGLAGGQVGYRWQASNWVFGVEAQGDWANLKGSNTSLDVPVVNAINQTKVSALGLFTGQVGYAWNNVLWYVKGGAAVTSNKYNGISTITVPSFVAGSTIDQGTETRWGGAVGTGIEFGFAPGWSLGVEYNHLFMGTETVMTAFVEGAPVVVVGSPARTESISQGVDIGLVRVNYTFGGPVVAKY